MGKLFRKRKGGCEVGNWKFKFQGADINTGTTDTRVAERYRRKFLGVHTDPQRRASSAVLYIDGLLELVEQDYRRRRLRTLDKLDSRVRKITGLLNGVRADELTADDLADYAEAREVAGASPATINRELETIRRGLRLAVERGLLLQAPKVTMATEENVREVDLEPGEYETLIAELREPVRLLAVLAYHIGWRAGRILTLRWSQVNLEAGLIRPPARQAKNKWVGAAPIYGELRRALLVARAEHEKNWPLVDHVFHRAGRPLKTYRAEWERARAAIGRPDLHFHDLRHAAVTNMLNAGLDESRVMAIVGHKTFAMLRRYRIEADRHTIEAGRLLEAYQQRVAETASGGRETKVTVN